MERQSNPSVIVLANRAEGRVRIQRLYKELQNPKRYRIIEELVKSFSEPLSAEQLSSRIGIVWSTAAYHLKALEKANLVKPVDPRIRMNENGTPCVEKPYTFRTRALYEYGILELLLAQQDGLDKVVQKFEESAAIYAEQLDIVIPKDLIRSVVSFAKDNVRTKFLKYLRDYVVSRLSADIWQLSRTRRAFVPFFTAYLFSELSDGSFLEYLSARAPSVVPGLMKLTQQLQGEFTQKGLLQVSLIKLMTQSLANPVSVTD